ncbi:hypothetical protein JOD48_001996 [Oerskovia paurometabola]|nr:hypothetical protein [Oerskovia paurometabola]
MFFILPTWASSLEASTSGTWRHVTAVQGRRRRLHKPGLCGSRQRCGIQCEADGPRARPWQHAVRGAIGPPHRDGMTRNHRLFTVSDLATHHGSSRHASHPFHASSASPCDLRGGSRLRYRQEDGQTGPTWSRWSPHSFRCLAAIDRWT